MLTKIDRKRGVLSGLYGPEVVEGGVWLLGGDGRSYVGARFFKCDLHMHTPGDAQNWRDPDTRITREASDAHKAEVARAYLARCHEAGLEVIAVTDHNFARTPDEAFVNWLRKANDSVASELGRAPLVILPGFEIQANVGRGCHVLCVFPEGTDLHVVDGRLTNCGLSPDSRFDENGRPRPSSRHLAEIIEVVQNAEQHAGLVIAAHSLGDKGLLTDRISDEWLQQEEFRNLDLLCIEVPKPIEELSSGLRLMILGGDECWPEWRRSIDGYERPIAYVLSSDCHRLDPTKEDPSNYIGFRHTWVKMSAPSVEALRQAFLDRDSRIRLSLSRPEDAYRHPRITRVQINGAKFYKAPPVYLGPNLNCIIGSRGSGKSTLIDYIRLALDRLRQDEVPPRIYEDIIDRLRHTLTDSSTITVDFETSGIPYRVDYEHKGDGQWRVSRRDTGEHDPDWSIRTLLPIKAISQREIDESVERGESAFLARLLDEFIAGTLEELSQRETELKSRIKSIDLEIAAKKDAQLRRSALVTRLADMQGRIMRLEAVSERLERWTTIDDCDAYLRALQEACRRFVDDVEGQTRELCDRLSATVERTPPSAACLRSSLEPRDSAQVNWDDTDDSTVMMAAGTIVSEARRSAEQALDAYRKAMDDAIEAFADATIGIPGMMHHSFSVRWAPLLATEKAKYEELRGELQKNGDDPEEYLSLKAQLNSVLSSIEQLDDELRGIEDLEQRRVQALSELRRVWQQQTDARNRKAEELMERLTPAGSSKPLVEIEVSHQANEESIMRNWSRRLRDRRRVNDQDISSLMLLAAEIDGTGEPSIQDRMIRTIRTPEMRTQLERGLGPRTQAFLEIYTEETLRELEIERTEDRVIYRVRRRDGSLAGPIDRVSVGQKGLAFLHVLLAAGDTPIIVDTPEEGLDSEGVYGELVPVFRQEKERRQLIVATHNANLPVNADAELIVTLEAVAMVDLDGPELATTLTMNESAAAVECVPLEDEDVTAGGRRRPRLPDRATLTTRVMGRNWSSDVRDYLVKSCGWSMEQANQLVQHVDNQREVCGAIRCRPGVGGRPEEAVGALDKPEVKKAVQDIMEGSEQAFRKRWEKYGF